MDGPGADRSEVHDLESRQERHEDGKLRETQVDWLSQMQRARAGREGTVAGFEMPMFWTCQV